MPHNCRRRRRVSSPSPSHTAGIRSLAVAFGSIARCHLRCGEPQARRSAHIPPHWTQVKLHTHSTAHIKSRITQATVAGSRFLFITRHISLPSSDTFTPHETHSNMRTTYDQTCEGKRAREHKHNPQLGLDNANTRARHFQHCSRHAIIFVYFPSSRDQTRQAVVHTERRRSARCSQSQRALSDPMIILCTHTSSANGSMR